jgi:hypothetical protein
MKNSVIILMLLCCSLAYSNNHYARIVSQQFSGESALLTVEYFNARPVPTYIRVYGCTMFNKCGQLGAAIAQPGAGMFNVSVQFCMSEPTRGSSIMGSSADRKSCYNHRFYAQIE